MKTYKLRNIEVVLEKPETIYLRNVYLAGSIGGVSFEEATSWRNLVTTRLNLHSVGVFDPTKRINLYNEAAKSNNNIIPVSLEDNRRYTISNTEIMHKDLSGILYSDIIFAKFPTANKGIGTLMELGIATAYQIPVVLWVESGDKELLNSIFEHPFLNQMTFMFQDLEEALNYTLELLKGMSKTKSITNQHPQIFNAVHDSINTEKD